MNPQIVVDILRVMGINYPADFQAIERMTFEQGEKALADLKEKFRKGYKKLAFELHPDRTGNDPEKTEQFKALADVRDRLAKITIQRAPPRPQVQVQRVQQAVPVRVVIFRHPATTMNVQGTVGTPATTTSYGPGGPWYTARMKPT